MKRRMIGVAVLVGLLVTSCGSVTPEASGDRPTITVHGDWTIEVYNADGSLDQHHEFSNALLGAADLAAILARQRFVQEYEVFIGRTLPPYDLNPCHDSSGSPSTCRILELAPGSGDSSDTSFTLDVTTGGANNDQLVLSGSHIASRDGVVTEVSSHLSTCPINDPPPCFHFAWPFTHKQLEPAEHIPVSEGQAMNVEVVISFGSG